MEFLDKRSGTRSHRLDCISGRDDWIVYLEGTLGPPALTLRAPRPKAPQGAFVYRDRFAWIATELRRLGECEVGAGGGINVQKMQSERGMTALRSFVAVSCRAARLRGFAAILLAVGSEFLAGLAMQAFGIGLIGARFGDRLLVSRTRGGRSRRRGRLNGRSRRSGSRWRGLRESSSHAEGERECGGDGVFHLNNPSCCGDPF